MRRIAPALVASLFAFGAVVAHGQAATNAADLKWGPAPADTPTTGTQLALRPGFFGELLPLHSFQKPFRFPLEDGQLVILRLLA